MPRVSSNELSEKDMREFEKSFYSFLASFKSEEEISSFFKYFLTREEQIMLTKRLKLFQLSSLDYSAEEIKRILNVSYESARSYKLVFEYKPLEFRKEIKRSTQLSKSEPENKILNAFNIAVDSRSSVKARAKLYQGDFEK